jgi:hypothetical protein
MVTKNKGHMERGARKRELGLSTLDGKNGFTISGNLKDEYSDKSVSGAGDINNDGLSDTTVGAPWWTGGTG